MIVYEETKKDFLEDVYQDRVVKKILEKFNTGSNDITNEHYKELLKESPIFLNGENDKLKEFIARYIKYGDNKKTLYKLEREGLKPSKLLLDEITSMIEGNDEFLMVEMQKNVFENAKNFAYLSSTRKDGKKRVYIVEGGPGTGKSVVAINLLGKLMKKYNMNCQCITKNKNLRDIYSAKLKGCYIYCTDKPLAEY